MIKIIQKVALTLLLLLISTFVYASDFTGLATFFILIVGFVVLIAVVVVTKLTKNMKNENIKILLRVLSVTIFCSLSKAGNVGYIWPSSIVFLVGTLDEKISSLISILIFTLCGFLLYKLFLFSAKAVK